ncbi:zeta toxin family protein [Kitasatospora sp. cg17-2]
MSERDIVPVVLPTGERDRILAEAILPASTTGAVAQDRPVVLFVAGQPGSGKSVLADLLHAVLDLRGGAVRICADLYKEQHRHYPDLLVQDVRTAGVKVRPDTRGWQDDVEADTRARRLDALVETALADPAAFRAQALDWRRAGYRIEVVALATAPAWSQLGVLSRFAAQVHATGAPGRFVSWENHDRCAKALLETLTVVEAERLADRVTVVRRGLELLYSNELLATGWQRPPGAARAVAAEHTRRWDAAETERFRRRHAEAARQVHTEPLAGDLRLAVARDAERAFALSEPLRRTAQALATPPGVAYHRLSAAEHREIFDDEIVPLLLDGIVPREKPVVVYVVAQPGAGKSGAALLVKRAMGPGAVRLVGDDLKMFHPDYFELLRRDPRGAGEAIRADYKAWFAWAEAYVRERRGDLVVETAPGSAHDVLAGAEAFRRAGYRVKVLVLAVRAADSLQGTAQRYAAAQRDGIPARFTAAAGHDRCFTAVADVVRAATASPAVEEVLVVDRDGRALALQQHGMPVVGGAMAALAAERARPFTEQEARRFLERHAALRRALPQHRAELARIAALARPLLPAFLQPARLGPPRPGPLPSPLYAPPSSSCSRAA